MRNKSLNVYFAGELFSAKHLFGNAILAESIWTLSEGRYHCHLPQDLDAKKNNPHTIRDECIKSVLSTDIGLFNYDGPELDSGTVVEYLFAKFADIPSVLLRTDFRKGGDQDSNHAWNLMTSFFPRTEVVIIDSMAIYKEALLIHKKVETELGLEKKLVSKSAHHMMDLIAQKVIAAMDKVMKSEETMPMHCKEKVEEWLVKCPGFKDFNDMQQLMELLKEKNCQAK